MWPLRSSHCSFPCASLCCHTIYYSSHPPSPIVWPKKESLWRTTNPSRPLAVRWYSALSKYFGLYGALSPTDSQSTIPLCYNNIVISWFQRAEIFKMFNHLNVYIIHCRHNSCIGLSEVWCQCIVLLFLVLTFPTSHSALSCDCI